jgi:hypothetical protein
MLWRACSMSIVHSGLNINKLGKALPCNYSILPLP